MTAAAALIAFALFLGVVYLVIRPFLAPEEIEEEDVGTRKLEMQKDRIIEAIREIDMDFQTGKLSEEDYQLLRGRYTAAAAEILRRMDEEEAREAEIPPRPDLDTRARVGPAAESEDEAGVEEEDDELEREIAARKAALTKDTVTKDAR